MLIQHRRDAFTVLETMIAAVLTAIILAIAIPNILKAGSSSAEKACISNLKQIDAAVEQWAFDNGIPQGVVPNAKQESEVYAYITGKRPSCPSRGEYALCAVGTKPQVRCSREAIGHRLPE
jgi:competence protein ComGC